MDERASIPVTLPRDGPTESYWQDPPDAIADLRSTDTLSDEAEVVIIGSGITGAAVAWNLLENGQKSIVMLEARQACSGATGRNGGHTKAASYRSFLHHAEQLGTDAACQIARLELANIKAVHAFAQEHDIPCDLNPCDTIDIIYDPGQWEGAHKAVAAMQEAMPNDPASEYTFLSKEQVATEALCGRGGDEGVHGGVKYFAGSLSAYKLVIGVLKLALERGLNLQTNTPATKIVKMNGKDGRWIVETPRGSIKTERVVVATNGYTARLLEQFQGVITPLRGQITAQRPGSKMPGSGLSMTYSFSYSGGYEYMIPRPKGSQYEGDIIIGGGLTNAPENGLYEYGTTDDTTTNHAIGKYLHDTLPRYFGDSWGEDHPGGRIRKEWTGIMGYSPDGFPFVGEVPGRTGLWTSASFQGHGMVLCWMCARALVEMMEGRIDEGLEAWFPKAFRLTKPRLSQKFQGRLHVGS